MGRLDCSGFNNTYCGKWGGYVRHEKDIGEQESAEKENSGKCRDEW